MTEQEQLLAKAANIKSHLGKMLKAHHEFHAKMAKLHGAHKQDMHTAFTQLHKLVGIEPSEESVYGGGNNEPKSTDLEGAGTKNLQVFPGEHDTDAGKAASAESLKKAGLSDDEIKEIMSKRAEVAKENSPLTKGDMKNMFTEMFTEYTKALLSTNTDSGFVPTSVSAPFNKGIGDRNNLQQPLARISPNGDKQNDTPNADVAKTTAPTVEMAKKALDGGSIEDQLAFMKSARPAEIPTVLVDQLQKVH